jgi:hypothetical protein
LVHSDCGWWTDCLATLARGIKTNEVGKSNTSLLGYVANVPPEKDNVEQEII